MNEVIPEYEFSPNIILIPYKGQLIRFINIEPSISPTTDGIVVLK